ncbi:hypothetical protein [Tunturiibacter gelidiferens]|uniref:hypothetical protein n=1 Tax=Tunturiibacter gelidiferens TaxID=3069689 RepID=UPI003D9BF44D
MDALEKTVLTKRWILETSQMRNPPSGRIPADFAAAKEHYNAAEEGHVYVYNKVHIALIHDHDLFFKHKVKTTSAIILEQLQSPQRPEVMTRLLPERYENVMHHD